LNLGQKTSEKQVWDRFGTHFGHKIYFDQINETFYSERKFQSIMKFHSSAV
jgi:hypothetical protein